MHFHFALHPTGSVAGPAICFIFYGRYMKWSVIARCHRWAEICRWLCVRVSSPLHGVPSHGKGHISISYSPVNHLPRWCWWFKKKNMPPKAAGIRDTGLIPRVWKIPWRRAWQPSPVFLPGESPGQRSLAGLRSMGLQKSRTRLKWLHNHTCKCTFCSLDLKVLIAADCLLSQMAERHPTHQSQNLSQTPSSLTLPVRPCGSSDSFCVCFTLRWPLCPLKGGAFRVSVILQWTLYAREFQFSSRGKQYSKRYFLVLDSMFSLLTFPWQVLMKAQKYSVWFLM